MNPKVSIIVPCYNCAQFVHKTILSIVNQTYDNIELILVDDASTDNTKEVLLSYQEKYPQKIKTILLETNGRQAAARKKGFEQSTGDYIFFVDSDDTLTEYAVSLMVAKATKYEVDIVIGQSYINASNTLVHRYPQLWLEDGGVIGPKTERIVYDYTNRFVSGDNIYHSYSWQNCLWKRSLFERADLYWAENVYYNEDTILMYQLYTYANSMMFIPFVTYVYNIINENGYLASFHNKDKEIFNYVHKYYAYIWTYFFIREKFGKEVFFNLSTVCNHLTYMYFYVFKKMEDIRNGNGGLLTENEIWLFKECLSKFGTLSNKFSFSDGKTNDSWEIKNLLSKL